MLSVRKPFFDVSEQHWDRNRSALVPDSILVDRLDLYDNQGELGGWSNRKYKFL